MASDYYQEIYEKFYNKLLLEEGLINEDKTQRQRAWHCDPLVLHAPGTCKGCDKYPDRQQSRIRRHVNFTGEYLPDRTSCPSEYFRPANLIHQWGGNRPSMESADIEIVEATPVDASGTENVLNFAEIVSTLASVTASLKEFMTPEERFIKPRQVQLEANLSSAEALVEILRSEFHPPLLIEPGPNESVIVQYDPVFHDMEDEVLEHNRVYVRPKSLEDDATSQEFKESVMVHVNGVEHTIPANQPISYHSVVGMFKEDRGEHEYRGEETLSVSYEIPPTRGMFTLNPGGAITPKPGMIFRVRVIGDE